MLQKPKTPLLTTDLIIELNDHPGHIVLVERRYEPLGWALPGGFVDVGEPVPDAARREALEETGLHVYLRLLLGVYSNPDRDPRMHTCSVVYVAEANGEPKAGDDAANIGVYAPNKLPPLAFDHERILEDYRNYLANGRVPGCL